MGEILLKRIDYHDLMKVDVKGCNWHLGHQSCM